MKKIELGISTFGDTTPLEKTGKSISHDQRIRDMIEEIELADQVGLDIYAIGEHHREDFAVSAPEIVLAAGAARTKNIRLSSAVSILSSLDPVRLYQQYATIDAISNGRAEIMAGRGSFTESFPLFGYDLRDYNELFDEKLAMLQEIRSKTNLNWQGKFTQNVEGKPVFPRAVQEDFPLWVATGGNIESTLKIAQLGLPVAYAIIGGNPLGFKRLIEAYRQISKELGHKNSKVAAHSWGWIADSTDKAVAEYWHPTKTMTDGIGRDRPHWSEMAHEDYLQAIGENGSMIVGDPDAVADKIINLIENLNLDRFLLHLPIGSMPHEDTLRAIQLYGEKVAPKVRAHFENKI